jgi:adenosylhomocysteine nucleosidase
MPTDPPACHVAVVFALRQEAGWLLDRMQGAVAIRGAGFVAHEGGLAGRRVVVAESGVGRDAARKITSAIIAGHNPWWVVSAGFAGGLDDRLNRGDFLLASEVADEFGATLPIEQPIDPASVDSPAITRGHRVHVGRLVTVDRLRTRPEEKRALGQRLEAVAVDMETWAVADVCRRERARFLSIRIVTDAVDDALPPELDHLVKQKTLVAKLGAAAGAIFRRPASFKQLWQLKEDALVASDQLAQFIEHVVPQLVPESPQANQPQQPKEQLP